MKRREFITASVGLGFVPGAVWAGSTPEEAFMLLPIEATESMIDAANAHVMGWPVHTQEERTRFLRAVWQAMRDQSSQDEWRKEHGQA